MESINQAYPRPAHWTPAFGDTAMIAGVGNGVISSAYFYNYMECPAIPFNWLGVDFVTWFGVAMLRTVVGVLSCAVVRNIFKTICISVLVAILPPSKQPIHERYAIGVPTKFITYTVCLGAGVGARTEG